MVALYISLGIIGGLILLFFVGLYIIYHGVFYTPLKWQQNDYNLTKETLERYDREKVIEMIDKLKAIPYEDAYIISYDDKKLHGRIYRNPESDVVCIMCHGYRGTSYRDFSGGAVDMIERGFNVILIDQRGHGLSKGHSITFGRREQRDCLSWITYSEQIFGKDKKLVLLGISMGGATVLMASNKVKEGTKIIADCPYTTEKEIICETMKTRLKLNPKIFWPFTNLASIIFGHANLNKDDAKKNIGESKAKILIIHGESDTLVPYKFSYKAYEMYPDKVTYALFPNAEHGLSYLEDKKRYQQLVSDFLNS